MTRQGGQIRNLILLLLVFALGGKVARAEEAAPEVFGDILDVRVMNVEVVVEHRGKATPGLTSKDFELLVDGKPVAIEFFTEIRDGLAVPNGNSSLPGAVPGLAAGRPVGTRYLIFVDEYFTLPSRRDHALRRLRQQLKILEPEDQMAIVAYDGRKVDVLSSWTGSTARLSGALERGEERPAYGLQRRSEAARLQAERRPLGRLRGSGQSFSNIGFSGAQRITGDSEGPSLDSALKLTAKTSRLATAASSAMRGFALAEGRKVMLLFSGGLPLIAEDGFPYGQRYQRNYRGVRDTAGLFGVLVDTANRLGFTLYPVDLGDSADRGNSLGGPLVSGQLVGGRALEIELAEDSFHYLANATGGRSIADFNRTVALEHVAKDTRSYYWLGFSPTWNEDDQDHELEVKVKKRGYRTRARQSYSDLSRSAWVDLQIESAHLFDALLPNADGLTVKVGQPVAGGRSRIEVPIELRIQLDRITLPSQSTAAKEVELRVLATDQQGDSAEIPVTRIDLTAKGSANAEPYATYEFLLKLRRRPHRLLFSIYEPRSGVLLAERVELEL